MQAGRVGGDAGEELARGAAGRLDRRDDQHLVAGEGLQRAVLVADRRLETVGRGDGLDGAAAAGAGDVSGDGLRVGGDRATAGEQGSVGAMLKVGRWLGLVCENCTPCRRIGGHRSRRHWRAAAWLPSPGLPK